MNRSLVFFLLLVSQISLFGSIKNYPDNSKISKTSIPFILNKGQISSDIEFYVPIITGDVFITNDGEIIYNFGETKNNYSGSIVFTEFLLDSYVADVVGIDKSSTSMSFIKGNEPCDWKQNIPTYNSLYRENIYDGIDMSLKAYGGGIEKVFYVSPNSDPDQIQLSFKNEITLSINHDGELVAGNDEGYISFTKPVAYQQIDNTIKYVDVKYAVNGSGYAFELGDYDRSRMLIIDPVIASTFIGGSSSDGNFFSNVDMVLDYEGNIIIAGTTTSANFPTAYENYDNTLNGLSDIFVAKFSPDLGRLISGTYIGGNDSEELRAVDVDGNGNIFITGFTASADYPVSTNAFQTQYSMGNTDLSGFKDVFVTKLSSDLSSLISSTFLGVDRDDYANAIDIDGEGNVYIAGSTSSLHFPMGQTGYRTGKYGYGTTLNWSDGFISKFDNSLTTLIASSYFGSTSEDYIETITIAPDGSIFVGGNTKTTNLPTTDGAYQEHNNNIGYSLFESFIAHFNSDLNQLLSCTYLGDSFDDYIYDICVDSENNIYVTGTTRSNDFPTTEGAFDVSFAGGFSEVFVSKFNYSLTQLLGSTFLGGHAEEVSFSLCVDEDNAVYVGGQTNSSNFPVTDNAYNNIFDNNSDTFYDIFITKLNSDLTSVYESTFLGGTYDDTGGTIAMNNDGNIIVAGSSFSVDYPVSSDPYCEFLNWSYDVVVTIMDPDLSADITSVSDNSVLPKEEFILYPNYPNPFNPSTNFQFYLGRGMNVVFAIYDITGQEIARLIDNDLYNQGFHSFIWDGKNEDGIELSSGTYFARLYAEDYSKTIKLLLVR